MEWITAINKAVSYIEEHITEELDVKIVADSVNISAYYFGKGFSMLCGYTLGEYIRMRRLSLAGSELVSSDIKIIDLAVKYGYDSPDSFTKAFVRFHGNTPIEVRKNGFSVKSFAPLRIKFSLDGGNVMEYKIEQKDAFKVMGISRKFSYEAAKEDTPVFWQEVFGSGNVPTLGKYGVNHDSEMSGIEFNYMIAGDFDEKMVKDFDLEVWEIPAHTWAIFPCKGKMPEAFWEVNRLIYSDWLANEKYEFAEGYCIEVYGNPADFKEGVNDPEYTSEIWIPVKEKGI